MTIAAIVGIVFLFAFNLNVGLQCTRREILDAAHDRWAVARALVLLLVMIPAAAFLVAHGLRLERPLVVAMIVLAVAPGAPLAPNLARQAHASIPFTVLMLEIVAVLVPFTAPVTARLLLGYHGTLDFHPLELIARLVLFQLLPLAIGIAWKTRRPGTTAMGEKITRVVYSVALLLVVAVGIIPKFKVVVAVGAIGLLATLILMTLTWLFAWIAGGPSSIARRTLSTWVNVPNPGVATLLVKSAGGPPEYVAAIQAMFLVRVIVNLVYVRVLRSRRSRAASATA